MAFNSTGGSNTARQLIAARGGMLDGLPRQARPEDAAEGGCGVLGFASALPVSGRHVLAASRQMHNRGNGKGGGIAMAGLLPEQAGVDAPTLRSHTLLQIALLDPAARAEVEAGWIEPYFDLAAAYPLPHLDDYRLVDGLKVRPPDVWRYFGRVKPLVLERFAGEKGLEDLPPRQVEDEFVYQNTFDLNRRFYASLGEKRAFVLSHARNLSVLKIVGYAEQVVEYYCLQDTAAHVWIAHQRYPTKGRVWHPGGAHPFIGMNEALVHNGDFANYHAVGEYLRQRNIGQLFLTDTEVSVQLFDLWNRVHGYPLEIILEAMAPTAEHDFAMLPAEKRALYAAVQRAHIHGSPDGPWFFILARTTGDDDTDRFELLGITDTSMLRPQVFALYENQAVQIGLIASERQAINACLRSLAGEDGRYAPVAERYWAARGGSHTDGGAFSFSVEPGGSGLTCRDKFGQAVRLDPQRTQIDPGRLALTTDGATGSPSPARLGLQAALQAGFTSGDPAALFHRLRRELPEASWEDTARMLEALRLHGEGGAAQWELALETLTLLRDRRYPLGMKGRASLLRLVDAAISGLLQTAGPRAGDLERSAPRPAPLPDAGQSSLTRAGGPAFTGALVMDVSAYPPEGGVRHIIAYGWRGGRFAGCGLGPGSAGLRIDLYGDVGDYAASGLDGAEVHIHGDGQDQIGQVMKSGRLVIHGDAGQTLLYGAKGGETYVLGSAAGRPLINAVGRPRLVINGVCLDYLAESFMAGDPLDGGGFAILNGVAFDDDGCLVELETPYPGGNLFSLASGGAIYLRDPRRRVSEGQLNGGAFQPLEAADWALIEPVLRQNERLFDIPVEELLTVDGVRLAPYAVYRKVGVGAPLNGNGNGNAQNM